MRRPDERLTIRLCGGLALSCGGATLGPRQLGGAKARQILLALCLHHGAGVSKTRLVELLWGTAAPHGATATLESYVSLLRRRLELLLGGTSPVRTMPGGYLLDVDSVDLDVRRFEQLVALASEPGADPVVALGQYASALSAVQAPLLPEEDTVWATVARQAHNSEVLRATVDAAELALAAGAHGQAERWAAQALHRDQFSEPAWFVLLRSFELRGQHADGLRAYESCRSLFASELGCPPGARVREVFPRLLGVTEGHRDDLDDLLDAVFRLHLALAADPAREGVGLPRGPDANGSAPLTRAFEDDSTRLKHLLDDVTRQYLGIRVSA
ncbi:AfsR/SARP family transcriptional regulator [Terrabacter sp. 2RAF25]|uniref:AfsR/SARP family transcriptional regulator n=1 Tax=Terrabacter sp. 2RAF25 TaxID=3232998 RepID=UPI003F9A9F41